MGGDAQLVVQGLGEQIGDGAVPMDHKDLLGLGGEALHPGQQMAPVGVGGQALEVDDAGPDGDLLAEELDGLGPLQQAAAQGALRLIAHKDHGALRPPQVML